MKPVKWTNNDNDNNNKERQQSSQRNTTSCFSLSRLLLSNSWYFLTIIAIVKRSLIFSFVLFSASWFSNSSIYMPCHKLFIILLLAKNFFRFVLLTLSGRYRLWLVIFVVVVVKHFNVIYFLCSFCWTLEFLFFSLDYCLHTLLDFFFIRNDECLRSYFFSKHQYYQEKKK